MPCPRMIALPQSRRRVFGKEAIPEFIVSCRRRDQCAGRKRFWASWIPPSGAVGQPDLEIKHRQWSSSCPKVRSIQTIC